MGKGLQPVLSIGGPLRRRISHRTTSSPLLVPLVPSRPFIGILGRSKLGPRNHPSGQAHHWTLRISHAKLLSALISKTPPPRDRRRLIGSFGHSRHGADPH